MINLLDEWMNLPPLFCEMLRRRSSQFPNPMANKNGFQELNRKARRGMSQEPQVQRARPLMFLRGDYMIYIRSEGSQGSSCDPNSDIFGSLIFLTQFRVFHLIRREPGSLPRHSQIKECSTNHMPCNSSFPPPFRAFRDKFFPGPSIPASNKHSRSGINLLHPGKAQSNQLWRESVAHTMSLSFPQHQPSISPLRLCQKEKTGSHNSHPQGTPQHQHLASALKMRCGGSPPPPEMLSLCLSKQSLFAIALPSNEGSVLGSINFTSVLSASCTFTTLMYWTLERLFFFLGKFFGREEERALALRKKPVRDYWYKRLLSI